MKLKKFIINMKLSMSPFIISNNLESLLKDKKNIVPIAVIGSGPAGLTAGYYGSRAGMHTVVFTGPQPGGLLMDASVVENWPGMPFVSGAKAMQKLKTQAKKLGATIVQDTIQNVDFSQWPYKLQTDLGDQVNALSVIIATGAKPKKLGIEGEDKYWGKGGVLSCTICDAPLSKNRDVVVIGGDATTFERLMQLVPYAKSITLIDQTIDEKMIAKSHKKLKQLDKVKILRDKTVTKIIGNGQTVTAIEFKDDKTKKVDTLKADMVYLSLGFEPNVDLFKGKLKLNKNNFISIDCNLQKTSQDGIFAAGNVSDPVYHQAAIAAGDGSKAALEAIHFLHDLDFDRLLDKGSYLSLYKYKKKKEIKKIIKPVAEINSQQGYENVLKDNQKPVMIEFFSPQCPHCINMSAILDKVAASNKNKLKILKVDCQKLPQLAQQNKIMGLPTFVLYKLGKETDRISGEMSKKKLLQFINGALTK